MAGSVDKRPSSIRSISDVRNRELTWDVTRPPKVDPFRSHFNDAGYPISQLLLTGTMPSLSKADMILQDMQTHYENLVDQVLSTHSEDVLLALIKKPQVLLETPSVKDRCLYRVPHWLGKEIHETHTRTVASVAPIIEEYMAQKWPSSHYLAKMTPAVTREWLIQLNQNLMARLRLMDPDHATKELMRQLSKCSSSIIHPGSFLADCVSKMKKDLVVQLHEHVGDLVQLVYDDLQDEYLDD
ncbi:hypothetical protein [Absidia glauca]|uniref:Uncharacterized protein n=1 Tax=Absidia glauca TaxID=4829 RepID=A0A168Q047_ABSGL|nr:hypothetical protein [Absidia glauca]